MAYAKCLRCGKTAKEKPYRWAYPDGSGEACYYCDRCYKTQLSHKERIRAKYISSLKSDKNVMDNHKMIVGKFIDARKSGKKSVRTGGRE